MIEEVAGERQAPFPGLSRRPAATWASVSQYGPPEPLDVYEQVYTARKVDTAALRVPTPRLSAAASEAARARAMAEELGTVAPQFVQLTNDVVFGDLWQRSDLTPRDRSLVTIAALGAIGDDDQLDFYLRRGLESGLTRGQVTEALTHLGFYAGWTRATRALTAATRTLGK